MSTKKSSKEDIQSRNDTVFVNNYIRYPAVMVKGEGCVLQSDDGRSYLDFLAGIAVCSFGHCHPGITEAVCRQAGELVHVSNLYYTRPQTELAELLVANSFADKVFMCNSGAEANEAAIKLARISSGEGRYQILSLEGSFHGRTLATVAATGQPKFHKGFEPLPEGFVHVPFGDIEMMKNHINEKTCAILCEPIQGESGVRPLGREYLAGLRKLCDENGLLLIFDEVQTGLGRSGTLFAYEQSGVVPDIMTLAKALGNGFPIGAMLTREDLAAAMVPGTHASTFGGNPVAAAAGVAVMNILLEEGFLEGVRQRGEYLRRKLTELVPRFSTVLSGSRGAGMLQALVLTEAGIAGGTDIVNAMFDRGFLINFAGNTALRFAPPLIVTEDQIDQMVTALAEVLTEVAA
ncbi:MAG: acetylornithine transaminase [Desulfopila sp.]|jgi:acetylornithine aminotransferase/acetylornithine/N-succinyldiaminopimelate aminotransferase|nr:acetylornithine transaminase [Desulfopila sp.]